MPAEPSARWAPAGATIPAAGLFTFGWWFVVGVVVALVRVALPSTRRDLRERAWDDELAADDVDAVDDAIDEWDDGRRRAPAPGLRTARRSPPTTAPPSTSTRDDAPQRAPAALVFADHDLDDRWDDDRWDDDRR